MSFNKKYYDEVYFDLDKPSAKLYSAKQGDTRSRGFYIKMLENNLEVPVDKTNTITLYMRKPDNKSVIIAGEIEGDMFRIDLSEQALTACGIAVCDLELVSSTGETIGAKSFKLHIERSVKDGTLVSTNERGMLDRAFELANVIVPRIELLDLESLEGILEDYTIQKEEFTQVINDFETTSSEKLQGFDLTSSAKLTNFDTDSSAKLTNFDTDSSVAINSFVAETERVEGIYPARLTSAEEDLMSHKEEFTQYKLDYDELEGSVTKEIYDLLYRFGNEYTQETNGWEQSYIKSDTTTGSFTKEIDHLNIKSTNNGGTGDIGVSTNIKIDLTNIDTLFIDWEQKVVHAGANSTLHISEYKNQPFNHYEKREIVKNQFSRQVSELDVSNLAGEYYIKVHGMNNSTDGSVDINVFQIYANTQLIRNKKDSIGTKNLKEKSVTSSKRTNVGDFGLIASTGIPNFDLDNKMLTIPRPARLMHRGTMYTLDDGTNDVSVSLEPPYATLLGVLFYNTLSKSFIVRDSITFGNVSEEEILIATYYHGSQPMAFMAGHYLINGKSPLEKDSDESLKINESGKEFLFKFGVSRGHTYLSDHTFVGDELWSFTVSNDEHTDWGTVTRYSVNENTQDVIELGSFEHNFGHVNTVDYCEVTDTLIMGNGGGSTNPEPDEVYIFENASNMKSQTRVDVSSAITLHLNTDGFEWGKQVNTVWGEANGGKFNIAYIISNDHVTQFIHKIILGQGTNQLENGTFINGKVDVQFNGTYKILNEYTYPYDIYYANQGTDWHNGFLYEGFGHDGLAHFEKKLNKDGSITAKATQEQIYDDYGVKIDLVSNGICVKDNLLYIGESEKAEIHVFKL